MSTIARINNMAKATALKATSLDDARLTAVGMIMEVHQGLIEKFAPTFARHGMSVNEFEVLLRLGRTPGGRLRMSDLAMQTKLTTSGVTRVIDRLEKAGLVDRTTCDDDRRGTWAQISATGITKVSDATSEHLDDVENWFTGRLSADQLDALTTALRAVRDAVRPDAVAGA